jgi:uncharacterized membrane protein
VPEPSPARRRRLESRSDDPTGGAGLTRRLVTWLPVAAVVGAVLGGIAAYAFGEWRLAVSGAALAVALTGAVLAAVEDGRVQRRVDRISGRERERAVDPPGRRTL